MKLKESLAILKNNGYICERYYDDDETNKDTIKVPIYINKLTDYKGNPYTKAEITCRLGLTKEEIAKIEEILPDFVKKFDWQYEATGGDGNGIEVLVEYRGEEPSWDGRDFGTYDPGWGETDILDDADDIREKVSEAVKETLQYMPDDFDEEMETLGPKLEAIWKIIANRQGKDAVG